MTTPLEGRSRSAPRASPFGFDFDDARTLVQLVASAIIVVGAAGTLGLAVRLFIATAGIGGGA